MPQWCSRHQQHTIDEACSACEQEGRIQQAGPELLQALTRFANDVEGLVRVLQEDVNLEVIGAVNVMCVVQRLEEARAILQKAEDRNG